MAAVEVDENGLPISENATKLGHRKGSLIRTHCPVSYKTWKQLPMKYKNDVWTELRVSFTLPDTSKNTMIKGMADIWRRFKHELRIKYYDTKDTIEEKKLNVPPMVKEEDWKKICDNENNASAQQSRQEHKRKRENYDYTHCSGRKPHSQVKAELEKANPGVEITTSAVWIKCHTQADGKILHSAQPYYDGLKKAEEEIKDKLAAGTPGDESDALTLAFGKDSRGRVRSIGSVSRQQYDLSAPARAKVAELKAIDGDLKHQVKEIRSQLATMLEGFGSISQVVMNIQAGQASCIGSNHHDSSQGPLTPTTVDGNIVLPAQLTPGSGTMSPAQSIVGDDMRQCTLLNLDGETIAVGKVCTGASGLMAHGSPVASNHCKVLLDHILLKDELTIKANKFAKTFKEVGIGGFVVHPKICIKYD